MNPAPTDLETQTVLDWRAPEQRHIDRVHTAAAEKKAAEGPPLFRSYSGLQLCKSPKPAENRKRGATPVGKSGTAEGFASPRDLWLDEVHRATAPFRQRRAKAMLERAAEVAGAAEQVLVGAVSVTDEGWHFCPLPPADPRDRQDHEHWADNPLKICRLDTRWWEQRAEALRTKTTRVKNCGGTTLVRLCNGCGTVHETRIRCRDFRLCLHCRQTRMTEYQARFERSHLETVKRNEARGYHKSLPQHGYRWSPRFVTLTIPHSKSLKADLAQFPKAWPRFLQRMRKHFELDRGLNKQMLNDIKYVRVLEITPGGNGREQDVELKEAQGHAHMHLYLYSPYVDRDLVAHLWGKSLDESYRARVPRESAQALLQKIEDGPRRVRLAGLLKTRRGPNCPPLAEVLRPVVDVRACKGTPREIAKELAKYIVKDGERDKETGELRYVDPEWFALAYEALYLRRSISASRYFWIFELADPPNAMCGECGSWEKISYFQPTNPPRGPPKKDKA